ncbi:MAG: hypothetical protein HQL95_15950 [Magnetococcales bacterium]|nr:hypothetical protein [Magnetococcales bacterium]
MGILSYNNSIIVIQNHPILRFRAKNAPPDTTPERACEPALGETLPDPPLRCAFCSHPITHPSQRIEIASSHEHTFFNPHGHLFHLGCFRQARGCITTDHQSMEFTWFKGYAWTLAGCGQCLRHLGWKFQNNADHFFALILNRMKEQKKQD